VENVVVEVVRIEPLVLPDETQEAARVNRDPGHELVGRVGLVADLHGARPAPAAVPGDRQADVRVDAGQDEDPGVFARPLAHVGPGDVDRSVGSDAGGGIAVGGDVVHGPRAAARTRPGKIEESGTGEIGDDIEGGAPGLAAVAG